MKILTDLNSIARSSGGVVRYAHELTAALLEQPNVDCVVVAPDDHPIPSRIAQSVEVIRSGSHVAALERSRFPAEVLFFPNVYAPLRPPSIPSLVVVHDIRPLVTPGDPLLRRARFRLVLPRILRAADAVASNSAATADELSRRLTRAIAGRAISVLGAAAGLSPGVEREPSIRVPPKFSLVVGSDLPHKNLDTVWDALAEHPQFPLVLAGRVERFVNLPGRESQVVITPDDAELRWLYSHASVVICPSRYEGVGLSLLEARAFGRPVVASDIPAHREFSSRGAVWVDPRAEGPEWVSAVQHAGLQAGTKPGSTQCEPIGVQWERIGGRIVGALQSAVTARSGKHEG